MSEAANDTMKKRQDVRYCQHCDSDRHVTVYSELYSEACMYEEYKVVCGSCDEIIWENREVMQAVIFLVALFLAPFVLPTIARNSTDVLVYIAAAMFFVSIGYGILVILEKLSKFFTGKPT
jgi:hypothetical protein